MACNRLLNHNMLFTLDETVSTIPSVPYFNRIKNNDSDCVIMLHDHLGKIQLETIRHKMERGKTRCRISRNSSAAGDFLSSIDVIK